MSQSPLANSTLRVESPLKEWYLFWFRMLKYVGGLPAKIIMLSEEFRNIEQQD